MKKTKKLMDKLIQEIEQTPVIQVACDRAGLSRNSFYRWMKENPEFLSRVDEAMSLGTGLVNDVAISNVLSGIKSKDPMYTKYWLDRKHPDFKKPFIYKIDATDILQYKRIVDEQAQVIRANNEAKELGNRLNEEKMKEAMKKVEEWQKRWFKKPDKEKEDKK